MILKHFKNWIPIIFIIFIIIIIISSSEYYRSQSNNISSELALELLKQGNIRFISNNTIYPHSSVTRVKETSQNQNPFVAVLGCADSRVPSEIIFDRGIGDIFNVRVAGNITTEDTIGSLEYAVEHLGVNTIVVLGHTNCGAVKAALLSNLTELEKDIPGYIDDILRHISPIIPKSKQKSKIDSLNEAIKNNIYQSIQQLSECSPIINNKLKVNKLKIVGALYDTSNGSVGFL